MTRVAWQSPSGATLYAVTTPDSREFQAVETMFGQIFPEYDHYRSFLRLSADQMNPPRANTRDHVWLVTREGEPLGFRLFSTVRGRNFGFGAYTGVLPAARGLGIGRWLMTQTCNQVRDDVEAWGGGEALGVVVEIAPPEVAPDAIERARSELSLAFHQACGARLLDIPYLELQIGWEDVGADQASVDLKPMRLAFYPTPERVTLQAMLSEAEEIRLVKGLYEDIYLQPPDSAQARRVIDLLKRRGER